MRKRTCGQCSSLNIQDSAWPVRCKTGRVKIISMPLCSHCQGQARRVINWATRTGRLAV